MVIATKMHRITECECCFCLRKGHGTLEVNAWLRVHAWHRECDRIMTEDYMATKRRQRNGTTLEGTEDTVQRR